MLNRAWRWARRNRAVAATLLSTVLVGAILVVVLRGTRTQQLKLQVESGLAATEWNEEHLGTLDNLLNELAGRDPKLAAALRERVPAALQEWGETPLKQLGGRLEPGDHDRARRAVALLQPLDPGRAENLDLAYRRRCEELESVFHLAPQHAPARSAAVFSSQGVTVQDAFLQFRGNSPCLTHAASSGTSQLRAVFLPSWEGAQGLGLLLNARAANSGPLGYSFDLDAPDGIPVGGRQPGPLTFRAARRQFGQVRIRIRRDGLVLRERYVPMADLPTGKLRLEARRQGDRLTFEVSTGDGAARLLECNDLFPLNRPGVCGVTWPKGVELESLQALEQTLAPAASPLEQADALFLAGRWGEALDLYQQQARISAIRAAGLEARVKAGVTLFVLNRLDEAARQLEEVTVGASGGNGWPVVAGVYLWVIRVRQKEFDAADAVLSNLLQRRSEGSFRNLGGVIPSEYAAEITRAYVSRWGGVGFARHDPNRAAQIDRALEVGDLLGWLPLQRARVELLRLRAYRIAGQSDRALELARKVVADLPPAAQTNDLGMYLALIVEYAWILRELGRPSEALQIIDRHLYQADGVCRPRFAALLVERARTLAALGRKSEAERTLEAFLSEYGTKFQARHAGDAGLMLGFLREERGDLAGAKKAWAAACPAQQPASGQGGGIGAVNHLIAGALGEVLTDDAIRSFVEEVLSGFGGEQAKSLQGVFPIAPTVLREAWRTPRGRSAARQLAFQSLSFREHLPTALSAVILETVRRDALGGTMTAEQEELVWRLGLETAQAFAGGTLSVAQVIQLGWSWKGITNLLGWAGVRESLPPYLRGPIAYVLGLRYLRRNQPQDARTFFEVANADAPASSILRRLVAVELKRLAMQ